MEKIDFPKWLRGEIEKRDWSQVDLSRKTGISTTQIARILSGERGMGVETLVSIAGALSLSPMTLIRKMMALPESGDQASFEDFQYLLPQLTHDEQEEIKQIAEMKIDRRKKTEQAERAKNFKPKKAG